MCELLVRIVDKVNDDPYLDVQCTKRGDVIVVAEDGHAWGRDEANSTQYAVVKVPGVKASDASAFLAPERNTDPSHPSRMLRPRAFAFDLTKSPKNLDQLLGAKVRKPPMHDPNVMD